MKLEIFPGTALTPEMLLHRLLENRKNITALMISILHEDDSADIAFTQMTMKEATFLLMKLQTHIQDVVNGKPDPGVEYFEPKSPA